MYYILEDMIFRHPTAKDGSEIWRIVRESKVLDVNSSYCYLMMGEYFSKNCIVAEETASNSSKKLAGFVVGFCPPEKPDTLFVWQVASDNGQRGKGLGKTLLLELLQRQDHDTVHYLEATISPSNTASHALFKAAAKSLGGMHQLSPLFPAEWFPPGHEEEDLCRIGPFNLD